MRAVHLLICITLSVAPRVLVAADDSDPLHYAQPEVSVHFNAVTGPDAEFATSYCSQISAVPTTDSYKGSLYGPLIGGSAGLTDYRLGIGMGAGTCDDGCTKTVTGQYILMRGYRSLLGVQDRLVYHGFQLSAHAVDTDQSFSLRLGMYGANLQEPSFYLGFGFGM
jgi:hypothetical protein